MKKNKVSSNKINFQNIFHLTVDQNQTCAICLSNQIFKLQDCKKCKICFSCQDQWFSEQIKTQINDPNITEVKDIKISCASCIRQISQDEILKHQKYFPATFQGQTQFYMKRNNEFYTCPSGKCNNIGWMDNINCNELICTSCNNKWKLKSTNYTILNFTKTHMFQELLTKLFKLTCTKNCPNCKASIHKIGGCKKISCSQCKYSFCWQCKSKGHYNFQLKCFLICMFEILLVAIPFNYLMHQMGVYQPMLNQLSEFFTFYSFVFELQFIQIIPFVFRFFYKHAMIFLIYIIFYEKDKEFLLKIFLILCFVLWYFFTRWIEVFYYLIITPQILFSLSKFI